MANASKCHVRLRVTEPNTIRFTSSEYIPVKISDMLPFYEGPYEISASDLPQILSTAGHIMTEDLTVRQIPSNYGRIEWDGSVLTVS